MLRKITVDAPSYQVHSGIVGLSAEQAKSRAHNLKPVKPGKDGAGEYEVVHPIQFKRGETFGFSGQVGKGGVLSDKDAEELRLLEQAETVDKAVKRARAAAYDQARKEFDAKLAELRATVEAEVRAELEPRIREELSAPAKK